MSKYTQRQLSKMAWALLRYQQTDPLRYKRFVFQVSNSADVTPTQVEKTITEYAMSTMAQP